MDWWRHCVKTVETVKTVVQSGGGGAWYRVLWGRGDVRSICGGQGCECSEGRWCSGECGGGAMSRSEGWGGMWLCE